MFLTSLALTLTLANCPANAHCLEDENLLAVSTSAERAELILSAMQTAEARFADVFKRMPGLTAVVEDSSEFPGFTSALDEAGYIVKPWVSPEAMRAQLEAQVRPAVEAQMAGSPQAVIDATIEAALTGRVENNEKVRHAEAIIAHELGHMWVKDLYEWPQVDTGDARAYGAAAAPDWFDETAAVLMESEALTQSRRSSLCETASDDLPGQFERYFSMEHPLLQLTSLAADRAAAAAAAAGESSDGPRIMVMSGDTLAAQGADMIGTLQFYGLTRALIDYLVIQTGSEAVFDELAQALASGQSFDDWLATGEHGLPESRQALIETLTAGVTSDCAA
ncbi:hypothetical protein [Oceanicaulis sp. UBA2681]|uniref:hypothetical protein n=1 Tax=Oceanicaulis sp. UBA2681 TaxID=1947007 RepID=UPI000ED87511|nr:hypothetical protein [Oceanicaulis sp. UBA2681]HCR66208.1 hypothetical protein [Oceanicaulis sp.]